MGGINTYAYVTGNPLIYVDPMGLEHREAGQPGRGGVYGPGVSRGRFVSDLPPTLGNPNRVICTCGYTPEDADVDFFETPFSNDWTKILDGDVYLPGNLEAFSFGYGHLNVFGNGNLANGIAPSVTSTRTNGALWWLYGHKNPWKRERTPGKYIDDLNSGLLKSENDSCMGFFN